MLWRKVDALCYFQQPHSLAHVRSRLRHSQMHQLSQTRILRGIHIHVSARVEQRTVLVGFRFRRLSIPWSIERKFLFLFLERETKGSRADARWTLGSSSPLKSTSTFRLLRRVGEIRSELHPHALVKTAEIVSHARQSIRPDFLAKGHVPSLVQVEECSRLLMLSKTDICSIHKAIGDVPVVVVVFVPSKTLVQIEIGSLEARDHGSSRASLCPELQVCRYVDSDARHKLSSRGSQTFWCKSCHVSKTRVDVGDDELAFRSPLQLFKAVRKNLLLLVPRPPGSDKTASIVHEREQRPRKLVANRQTQAVRYRSAGAEKHRLEKRVAKAVRPRAFLSGHGHAHELRHAMRLVETQDLHAVLVIRMACVEAEISEISVLYGARLHAHGVHEHAVVVHAHGGQRLCLSPVQPVEALSSRGHHVHGNGLFRFARRAPETQQSCVPIVWLVVFDACFETAERVGPLRFIVVLVVFVRPSILGANLIRAVEQIQVVPPIARLGACLPQPLEVADAKAAPDQTLAEKCPALVRRIALVTIEHGKHHLGQFLQSHAIS